MNDIASCIRLKIFPYCEKVECMVCTLTDIYQRFLKNHEHKKILFPGSAYDAALILQHKLPFIKNMFNIIYENIAINDQQRNDEDVIKQKIEFLKLYNIINSNSTLDLQTETPDIENNTDIIIQFDQILNLFFACVKYADIEFALLITTISHDNHIPGIIRQNPIFNTTHSLIEYANISYPMKTNDITKSIEQRITSLIKDIELNIQPDEKQRRNRIFSTYHQIINTPKHQFAEKKYIINYLYFNLCRNIASSLTFCTKFTPPSLFLFTWD